MSIICTKTLQHFCLPPVKSHIEAAATSMLEHRQPSVISRATASFDPSKHHSRKRQRNHDDPSLSVAAELQLNRRNSPASAVSAGNCNSQRQLYITATEASSVVLGRLRASRRRPVEAQPTVGGRTSRRVYRIGCPLPARFRLLPIRLSYLTKEGKKFRQPPSERLCPHVTACLSSGCGNA